MTKKIIEKKKKEIIKKKDSPSKKTNIKKVKKIELVVKPEKYFEAIGRRKTAIARVRIFTKGEKVFLVNEKSYDIYFPDPELQRVAAASLNKMKCFDLFGLSVKVRGGGCHAQAEAIRHGVARALVKFKLDFQKKLKKAGYLTRDSRMRERKKFGLKRARRAPQWSKR